MLSSICNDIKYEILKLHLEIEILNIIMVWMKTTETTRISSANRRCNELESSASGTKAVIRNSCHTNDFYCFIFL